MNTEEYNSIENVGENMITYNPFNKNEAGLIMCKPGVGKCVTGDLLETLKESGYKVYVLGKTNNWHKRHHLRMRRISTKKIAKKKRILSYPTAFVMDEFHLFFSAPTAQKLVYAFGDTDRKETKVVQTMQALMDQYPK